MEGGKEGMEKKKEREGREGEDGEDGEEGEEGEGEVVREGRRKCRVSHPGPWVVH